MKIKPPVFFALLAVLIVLATFFSVLSFNPDSDGYNPNDVISFRRVKNQIVSNTVNGPFYQDPTFDTLLYFQPNPAERFKVDVYPIKEGAELDLMPDRPGYPSHKIVSYVVLAKDIWTDTLFVLKDLTEESDTLFFIPFSDESNGKETYGGGRYLDATIKPGKPVYIDFNLAYNPYCAYKADFVCPRTPAFNRLSRSIAAGEKEYPFH